MKRLFIFVQIISISFYYTSCQKDDSETTNSPSSIIDTWNCSENSSQLGPSSYQVDISKDTSSTNKVIIDNFYHLGIGKEVKATLSGQTLTVINESVDGYLFNGTGTIASNNNSISWSFTADDNSGSPDNVTATYSRM
jgi:hypothetical protein